MCATNLMYRIAQAALWRFTFTLWLKPSTMLQREMMFAAEALAGARSAAHVRGRGTPWPGSTCCVLIALKGAVEPFYR